MKKGFMSPYKFYKKGLSEMVAYAMLIAIALSISLIVYAWLKSYTPGAVEVCPEDIAIAVSEADCNSFNKLLNLSLQNKGLFTIDGYFIRVSNSSGIAIYTLRNETGEVELNPVYTGDFKPNSPHRRIFNYSHVNLISHIEVEPFILNKKNEPLLCPKGIINEEVNCG